MKLDLPKVDENFSVETPNGCFCQSQKAFLQIKIHECKKTSICCENCGFDGPIIKDNKAYDSILNNEIDTSKILKVDLAWMKRILVLKHWARI